MKQWTIALERSQESVTEKENQPPLCQPSRQVSLPGQLTGDALRQATIEQIQDKIKQISARPASQIKLLPADYLPSRVQVRGTYPVPVYAVNTYRGLVRNYNQDRVTIITNLTRGTKRCSFFGLYDGHGGPLCAQFLKQNLHDFVLNNQSFPDEPIRAINDGFRSCEETFVRQALSCSPYDRSGSCAVVVIIIEQACYIANLGDSRVIASLQKGQNCINLSRDHKPSDTDQQRRILEKGGRFFRSVTRVGDRLIKGPLRIFPGRLSLTRSFGDIQAKLPQLGGLQGALSAVPQILVYKLTSETDFLVLGCDGIFDKLQSQQVVDIIWDTGVGNVQNFMGEAVDGILRRAMQKESSDNLTAVVVGLGNFYEILVKEQRKLKPSK